MGFLNSRFTFNSGTGGQFHSSGVVNGESVTGSTSAQSFEQRTQINSNRQTISAYRDAGVLVNYRKEAHESGSYDPTGHAKHKKNRHSADESQNSNRAFARSSRIDIVKPSRQGFNASNVAERPNAASTMPERFKPTFSEPSSRKYNPYA